MPQQSGDPITFLFMIPCDPINKPTAAQAHGSAQFCSEGQEKNEVLGLWLQLHVLLGKDLKALHSIDKIFSLMVLVILC